MPLLRQCGTAKLLRACGTSKLLRACPPPTPVCSYATILATVSGTIPSVVIDPYSGQPDCYCDGSLGGEEGWTRDFALDAMPVTLTKVASPGYCGSCTFEGKIGTADFWKPSIEFPYNCGDFVYDHTEDLKLRICGMDSGNTNWYIYTESWMWPSNTLWYYLSIDWPGEIEAHGGTFTPWTPEFTRMFYLPATVDGTFWGAWYTGSGCAPEASISVTLEAP